LPVVKAFYFQQLFADEPFAREAAAFAFSELCTKLDGSVVENMLPEVIEALLSQVTNVTETSSADVPVPAQAAFPAGFVRGGKASDARDAAVTAIGKCIETFPSVLETVSSTLTPSLLAATIDPNNNVRDHAAMVVGLILGSKQPLAAALVDEVCAYIEQRWSVYCSLPPASASIPSVPRNPYSETVAPPSVGSAPPALDISDLAIDGCILLFRELSVHAPSRALELLPSFAAVVSRHGCAAGIQETAFRQLPTIAKVDCYLPVLLRLRSFLLNAESWQTIN
jgi:hypothetical protein